MEFILKSKPNIILFITHDQGQFLGCYDSPQTPNSLSTPNLDQIAEKGVKFTNYFCTAPQCSPSRGSIMTSKFPHQNGLMGLVNRGWTLPDSNITLPMYLKENDYGTHLIGLEHETNDVATLGYDTVSKRMKYQRFTTDKLEKDFLEFIEKHKHDEDPFFVNMGTFEIHRPFEIWNIQVNPQRVKVPPFLPDNEIVRKDLGLYYGVINKVDVTIGKILEKLEETDLREDTLFIYTTDHGSPFPRAKCTLYDPGIKTLLIMNRPNSPHFGSGKVIDQMISNIDLLPTLLDSIGAKIPKNIEGKSFLPLLTNNRLSFRDEIFTEKTFHDIYDPIRSIRTTKYKYIRNFEKFDYLYHIPADMEIGPYGKSIQKQIFETYNTPRMEEEFYDLENDPNEKFNLIDNPTYKDAILELKNRLFNWMKMTSDPLLKGKVQPQLGWAPL